MPSTPATTIAAVAAIYFLHEPLTAALTDFFQDNQTNAGLLAFVLLLLVPYAVMKLIARWAGGKTRDSVLGPIDRLLGMGFGVVKGAILVVLCFSILALGYDMAWGAEGRPDWIKLARSYPAVNSASKSLVETISARRAELQERSESI